MKNETTIDGRTYTVTMTVCGALLRADLIARGFDGNCYLLTGKRGAVKMAYRGANGYEVVA